MQAHICLSALKWYFIAIGLTYKATKAADTLAACHYAVALIAGNAVRWMDRPEVQGHALNSFLELKKLFIN